MKTKVVLSAMALFTASFGLLIAGDAPTEDAAKKERAKLQGTWQLVAGEIFGQGRAFKGPKEEVELEKVVEANQGSLRAHGPQAGKAF